MKTFLKVLVATIAAVSLVVGCSKNSSSSGGASSDMTISGTLSLGTSSMMSIPSKIRSFGDVDRFAATNVSDLEIYAIAFTVPPVIGQANVSSDGTFSVSLSGAKGSQVTAIFRDKTSLQSVGTVVFKDTTKKDMDGNAMEASSLTLSDSVSLGAISLADGKVVVDVANISTVADTTAPSSGTAFDPSGSWAIAAFPGTLPTGYMTAKQPCNGNNCQGGGPSIGESVYLIRLAGNEFTPNNNCTQNSCTGSDGTTGTAPAYALSFWQSVAAVGNCGYKLGFEEKEVLYFGRMNLSGNLPTVTDSGGSHNMAFGDYVFSTITGFGSNTNWASDLNNAGFKASGSLLASEAAPWMKLDAATQWSMPSCKMVKKMGSDQKTYELSSCKMVKQGATAVYAAHLDGGGCYDSSGKPVFIDWNWVNQQQTPPIQWEQNQQPCQNHSALSGIKVCSNSGTGTVAQGGSSISFTCSFSDGAFSDAALTTPSNTNPWGEGYVMDEIASGTSCATITDNLQRFRCFANTYFQSYRGGASSCSREYHFNWGAEQASQFVIEDKRQRPKENFMTEKLLYSPDGQTASIMRRERNVFTERSQKGESTCEVETIMNMRIKKMTDTQLLIDMQQDAKLVSSDNPTCKAAAAKENSELNSRLSDKGNMLFYLNKN